MAIKTEHSVDKIRLDRPIILGERAEMIVTGKDGNAQHLRTSPVQDWFYDGIEKLKIQTERSIYMGELENPEMLDPQKQRAGKREIGYEKIRLNNPVLIGDPAEITVTDKNGNESVLRTSPIRNYSYDASGRVELETDNSIYKGGLENVEYLDLGKWAENFSNAVNNMPQYQSGMEQ